MTMASIAIEGLCAQPGRLPQAGARPDALLRSRRERRWYLGAAVCLLLLAHWALWPSREPALQDVEEFGALTEPPGLAPAAPARQAASAGDRPEIRVPFSKRIPARDIPQAPIPTEVADGVRDPDDEAETSEPLGRESPPPALERRGMDTTRFVTGAPGAGGSDSSSAGVQAQAGSKSLSEMRRFAQEGADAPAARPARGAAEPAGAKDGGLRHRTAAGVKPAGGSAQAGASSLLKQSNAGAAKYASSGSAAVGPSFAVTPGGITAIPVGSAGEPGGPQQASSVSPGGTNGPGQGAPLQSYQSHIPEPGPGCAMDTAGCLGGGAFAPEFKGTTQEGYRCWQSQRCDAWGIPWSGEGLPTDVMSDGKTRAEQQAEARSAGYRGDFGKGGGQCFLAGNCDARGYPKNLPATHASAEKMRAAGYKGADQKGYSCYKVKSCDAWGIPFSGRGKRGDIMEDGRTRGQHQDEARAAGFLGGFGAGAGNCFLAGQCSAHGYPMQ